MPVSSVSMARIASLGFPPDTPPIDTIFSIVVTMSPSMTLCGNDGAVVQFWLPGVQVQQEEVPALPVHPPQDTRRDVDVITVECEETAVGRSGTGLGHVEPEKVRYSTEEEAEPAEKPPRTSRC